MKGFVSRIASFVVGAARELILAAIRDDACGGLLPKY
jgi:hypothetical protein